MIRASAGVVNRKRPLLLLIPPPPPVIVGGRRLLLSSTSNTINLPPLTAGSVVALRKGNSPVSTTASSTTKTKTSSLSSFHNNHGEQHSYRCQHQLAAAAATSATAPSPIVPDLLSEKHLQKIKILVLAMQSPMMKFPNKQQLSFGLSSLATEEEEELEEITTPSSSPPPCGIVTDQLQPYYAQIFGDSIEDIITDDDSLTKQQQQHLKEEEEERRSSTTIKTTPALSSSPCERTVSEQLQPDYAPIPAPQQQQQQVLEEEQKEEIIKKTSTTITTTPAPSEEVTTKTPPPPTTIDSKQLLAQKRKFKFAIEKAIRNKDHEKSFRLFETAINQNIHFGDDDRLVIDLFFLVVEKDPIAAYHVLEYCNSKIPNFEGPVPDMYRLLCKSIEFLSNVSTRLKQTESFIQTLASDLATKSIEIKKQAYPKLAMSLAEQRNGAIGPYAHGIYQFMIDNEFELSPKYLKRLLMLSRYNRQNDIPFEDVLSRLVEMDESPHPFHAIQAVHFMFPYTDERKMTIALKSLTTLFRRNLSDEKRERESDDSGGRTWTHYMVDMATLECISASAARLGSADMIMYIWEIMDLNGYSPNEAIYENTVVAFAAASSSYEHENFDNQSSGMLLHQAFTALAEMKREGFEVSRPLIRSFSRAIRSYKPDVEGALQILTSHDVALLSVESMNVILSAFAERGDVLDVLKVLEIMRRSGVKPDADSYSFALEVLGKNMARHRGGHFVWQLRSIDTADSILTKMEEHETDLTADVIRNYVELLCIVGEVSTANAIVNDFLSRDRNDLVSNKALYRLATANADEGDIDTARRLASMTSEAIPILYRKIKSKEVWHNRKNNKKRESTERDPSTHTDP